MKRALYVVAFGLLGLLLATVVHAGVEMIALQIIFGNPEQFSSSFWWNDWDLIHKIGGSILWLGGLFGGLYLGVIWWKPYGSKPGFYHWRGR